MGGVESRFEIFELKFPEHFVIVVVRLIPWNQLGNPSNSTIPSMGLTFRLK